MQSIQEEWRPVLGFEGYEVSNLGRVRSWISRRSPKGKPHIRRAVLTPAGYEKIILIVGSRRLYRSVHRLVAEAFIPNPRRLPIVRHLNHDPLDNRVTNLAWGSQADNVRDSHEDGRHPHGESHYAARLTAEEVRTIRRDPRSAKVIGEEYGVTDSAISAIRNRHSWKHIPPDPRDVRDPGVGSLHYRAKLSEADVYAIRGDRRPVAVIAADYGVSQGAIYGIKARRSWRHLP